MPDKEQRFKVITEFVRQGDSASVQASLDAVAKSATAATQAINTFNQAAGTTGGHAPSSGGASASAATPGGPANPQGTVTHADPGGSSGGKRGGGGMGGGGAAGAGYGGGKYGGGGGEQGGFMGQLNTAGQAGYMFGMGAQWAGIPGTGFLAQSGNLINGAQYMYSGLTTLLSNGTALAAIGGITIAVAALAATFIASTKAAEEFVRRITSIAAVTGMGAAAASKAMSTNQLMFGAAGDTALKGIASAQANITPDAMFMQQANRGGGYKYNLNDPFARWGVSQVTSGSRDPGNPQFEEPGNVLFQAAAQALKLDNVQRAMMINQLGPQVGGSDNLEFMIRRLEAGQANGQTPTQTYQALEQRGSAGGGFTPTKEQKDLLDEWIMSQNELGMQFGMLKAELGVQLLPVVIGFVKGITDTIEGIRTVIGWFKALSDWSDRIGAGMGGASAKSRELNATMAGHTFATSLAVALAGPGIGGLLALGGNLTALKSTLVGLDQPAKKSADSIGVFGSSFKAADFPNLAAVIKTFGDWAGTAFENVWKWAGQAWENIKNWLGLNVAPAINFTIAWLGEHKDEAFAWFSGAAIPSVAALFTGTVKWDGDHPTEALAWFTGTPTLGAGATFTGNVGWLGDHFAEALAWFTGTAIPGVSAVFTGNVGWAGDHPAEAVAWFTGTAIPGVSAVFTGNVGWAGDHFAEALAWFTGTAIPGVGSTFTATMAVVAYNLTVAQAWLADTLAPRGIGAQFTGTMALFADNTVVAWAWLSDTLAPKGIGAEFTGTMKLIAYKLTVAQNWLADALAPKGIKATFTGTMDVIAYNLTVGQAWLADILAPRDIKATFIGTMAVVAYNIPVAQNWLADILAPRGISATFTGTMAVVAYNLTVAQNWLADALAPKDVRATFNAAISWSGGAEDAARTWLANGFDPKTISSWFFAAISWSGDAPDMARTWLANGFDPKTLSAWFYAAIVWSGDAQDAARTWLANGFDPKTLSSWFFAAVYWSGDSLDMARTWLVNGLAPKDVKATFTANVAWDWGGLKAVWDFWWAQGEASRRISDAQWNIAVNWLGGAKETIESVIRGLRAPDIQVGIKFSNLVPKLDQNQRTQIEYLRNWPDIAEYAELLLAFGATGGIVTKPTLALIGEAGPEALVPLNQMPGASPLPPGALGGGERGGGMNLNFTLNVSGMDFSDRAQVNKMARAVSDQIMGNVRTMTSTGQVI